MNEAFAKPPHARPSLQLAFRKQLGGLLRLNGRSFNGRRNRFKSVIAEALSLIAEQPGQGALREFAARLQRQIRKGQPLSDALAQDPARPPQIMIALTASGEALGDLGSQFARLAAGFEARAAHSSIGMATLPQAH